MPKIIKEIKSLSGKEADKFAKKMLDIKGDAWEPSTVDDRFKYSHILRYIWI